MSKKAETTAAVEPGATNTASDPVTEATTDPVTEATADPVTEATTDPVIDPAADPVPTLALNASLLNHLCNQIDLLNGAGHRLALITDLVQLYGMTDYQTKDDLIVLEMEGLRIDPAPDMATALSNWANMARRAIMEMVGSPAQPVGA